VANKSNVEEFQTSWQKTANWAKSQGISQSAIYPVYQLDSKRLLEGTYPMSEAERTRAILAASNPNNVTPLPTDTPSTGSGLGAVGHFFGNVMHDASNIFTGLQPTKLIPSIVDGVVNTVEHPSWVLNPEKNTLAQWIPGVAVVGELMQGGVSNVLSHPLISFLDVLPIADTGVGVLAKAGLGAGIAERAGIPEALLGRSRLLGQDAENGVGALTLARKVVGNTKTGKEGLFTNAEGDPEFGKLTVSQRMKNYANAHMSGSDQAKLAGSMVKVTSVASHELAARSQAWDDAYAKLDPDQAKQAYDIWTGLDKVLGGNDRQTLINSNALPVEMKEFFNQTFKVMDYVQEKLLAAGEGQMVMMPDGTMEWRAATGVDQKVVTAREKLAQSIDTVDKASKDADRLSDNIQANDTVAKPAFEQLKKFKDQVNQSKATDLTSGGFAPDPGRMSRAARTEYAALRNRVDESRPVADQSPYHQARYVADQQRLRNFVTKHSNVKPSVDIPTIAKLIGRDKPNATQMRVINQIFGHNGLIDQVSAAYDANDFDSMRTLTLQLTKKLKNKSISGDVPLPDPLNTGLQAPVRISPLLSTTQSLADNLYKYAKGREKDEKALQKAITEGQLHKKIDAYAKATKTFNKTYRDNPAADWQPLAIRLQVENIAKSEEGKVAIAQALAHYKDQGKVAEEAEKEFREDPTRLVGLIMAHTKASSTSVFGGMLSPETINRAMSEAKDEIESLRAQGFVPHWVPNVTAAESKRFGAGDYTVKIQPLTRMSVDAAKSKMLDMRNTVFDIHAGFSKAMWEQVARDANSKFIDDIVIPGHAYKQSDLVDILSKMNPDLRGLATDEAALARTLEFDWGLTKFDPDARFGLSSKHIKGGETLWMPKDMVEGLQQVVDKNQFDPSGGVAKATNIFRTAVLGYSPRFVAHIGLGGTFLLALRHPTSFRFIGDAMKMMKDPDFRAQIHTTSTQIGYDKPESLGAMAFHEAAGKRMMWDWSQHLMEKLNLDPSKMTSWLKVIPQMTFKLTNTMTDMQRTLVYLDGAAKAERRGFYIDPESGERIEMTDARAQEEGMRAANRTMGNLAAMSPFERNMLTTIMPFYGWTKHVLTYVAEYPVDHPYRAMFLANMANMNSDQVSKALYTRIQNLFFLGSPDANGNVSAVDVRALNPLRDVANYATLGGLISSLNPVISAPFAMVDPQIVFGSNLLYPNVTYNQLYGTKDAAPSGSALTALEQFIPEATTVDAALGLSAQYRGLARSNPAALTKTIFESLNIPFAQVQHINLKQIAAQQEIDRYQAASTAAQSAFQSGDFGALGNVPNVPNPLQTDYNISTPSLEELYNQTLKQTGLPPSEVLPSLPAPQNV
jgi:hypothetical protein